MFPSKWYTISADQLSILAGTRYCIVRQEAFTSGSKAWPRIIDMSGWTFIYNLGFLIRRRATRTICLIEHIAPATMRWTRSQHEPIGNSHVTRPHEIHHLSIILALSFSSVDLPANKAKRTSWVNVVPFTAHHSLLLTAAIPQIRLGLHVSVGLASRGWS